MLRRSALCAAWLSTTLGMPSCGLWATRQSNATLATITTWRGKLSTPAIDRPTFVVLLRNAAGGWTVQSSRLFYGPGPFEFLARPGESQLFAFVDQNSNQGWDADEPSASSEARLLTDGEVAELGELTISTQGPKPPVSVTLTQTSVSEELVKVHRGDLGRLDEERFRPEASTLAYWNPAQFALKYGVGVSLLEPYAPQKTPVVFVHGAAGSPRNFERLIEGLDRSRFQPWVFSWPSGIRLELAATTLQRILADMQLRLGFEKLIIVAHSMGGLVARGFVDAACAAPDRGRVRLLVTLSSPFGGHEMARTGVEHAPAVVPNWLDMAQGSPYLVQLKRPLCVPHVLHFTYFGGATADGPTDGTVSVRSQLVPELQNQAAVVRGWPLTHDGILESAEVSAALNADLERALAQ